MALLDGRRPLDRFPAQWQPLAQPAIEQPVENHERGERQRDPPQGLLPLGVRFKVIHTRNF